jgi:hypothetical protein
VRMFKTSFVQVEVLKLRRSSRGVQVASSKGRDVLPRASHPDNNRTPRTSSGVHHARIQLARVVQSSHA